MAATAQLVLAPEKACRKCGVVKPLEQFDKLSRVRDGRRGMCKSCLAEWRAANRETLRQKNREWREANREEINAQKRATWQADPEGHRRRQRQSWWKHREKRLEESRAYRAVTREERTRYNREWDEANPEKAKARWTRQNIRRRTGRRLEDIDYGLVLRSDPCSYCGDSAGVLDHIDPVALGGPNSWDNLTAACNACNCRKHTKPLLEFLWGQEPRMDAVKAW